MNARLASKEGVVGSIGEVASTEVFEAGVGEGGRVPEGNVRGMSLSPTWPVLT